MPDKKTFCVLVVDDNRDFADTLAALVRLKGHEVFVAYSAAEGFRMAAKVLPRVVFHDIELPDFDGYEAARRLRRDARFENTLLVAVTGNDAQAIVEATKTAGFDRFIPKPVDYAALVEALRAAERRI